VTHDPPRLNPFNNGVCANCGEPIFLSSNGFLAHCYTVSVRCEDGKRVMVRRGP